jgi:hypothetical protein
MSNALALERTDCRITEHVLYWGEDISMKTTKNWLFGLLAAALFVSCDGVYTDTNAVDSKLRGTWESTDISLYSGTLVIGYDTITITGYSETQTPPTWNGGDDNKRPFKDFARNAPLTCYTEDGKLFIKTVTDVREVPYAYSKDDTGYYLFFAFGGRSEALKRTGY